MEFSPPRCPYPPCRFHAGPEPGFFVRRGRYRRGCDSTAVQRFHCRGCKRRFSRQTFRHDYRDHRPECNARVLELLTSGVGLRQTGRLVELDIHSVQKKLLKLSRTCWAMHENLSAALPQDRVFLLDEEETYEGASIRPVTMPVVIEEQTWFVVAVEAGSIRRVAPEGTARRRKQDEDERRHGRRLDMSAWCVSKVLRALRRRVPAGPLVLRTDEKTTYGPIAKGLFGQRLAHEQTSSTLHRGTHNPLFPINTTLAMTRDNMGRLRRKSWLVSKKHERLRAHAGLFAAYRNYVRKRFNRDDDDDDTSAKLLGLLPRKMTYAEVVAWRQDWGARSVHPMSHTARNTVGTRLEQPHAGDA